MKLKRTISKTLVPVLTVITIAATLTLNVQAQEAVVDIKLKPAGSFKVKSTEVKGFVTQDGDSFKAKDIHVGLSNIKTGIELRDKHTKDYLKVQEHKEAVLVSAEGKNGKGKGVIRIKGIEKPVEGTYKVSNGKILAKFPVKLSDFEISGIRYMGVGVQDEAMITVQVPVKK